MTSLINELHAIYLQRYAPPNWIINFFESHEYLKCAKNVVCYSTKNNKAEIYKLITHRQPVNISMHAYYDTIKMAQIFGFDGSISGYTELFNNTQKMPPNLGIYCYTPVIIPDSKTIYYRHVFNSIGIALDDRNQPDYKFLFDKDELKPSSKEIISNRLEESYMYLLACAEQNNLSKIAICHLGGGAFSRLYPGGSLDYLNDIWLPTVTRTINNHGGFLNEIRLLGANNDTALQDLKSKLILSNVVFGGRVPFDIVGEDSKDILFQNAWDPHSIAGNGNSSDNSLDGFFGRSTAISVLTFPQTNPYLSHQTI